MRRHSRSFIIYLLFAMIIVVFVFTFNTGTGRGGGCTAPDVPLYATVGSSTITRDSLLMGMSLLPSFLRTPGGMSFALATGVDTAALYRADLEELTPQQANAMLELMELVYLASDESERLGFTVDEKELARAMYPESFYKEEESMGDDGVQTTKKVFKSKEFNNWIVYGLHSSPQEYEEFITRVLMAFKLQSFLAGVVKVEPIEAELSARAKGTKTDISYVEFRPDLFQDQVEVSQEEIDKFKADNAEKIAAYYDGHPRKFHAQAGYMVSGIFVAAAKPPEPKRGEEPKEPEPPTEEEKAAAGKKAQEILDRLEGRQELFVGGKLPVDVKPEGEITLTADDLKLPEEPLARFKEVAKRESDHDETRDRSGMFLGWKTIEDLKQEPFSEQVAQALVGAKKDQVVGPAETPTGYWVLYLRDLREKKDVKLEDAGQEIAETLLKEEKAPAAARARAEALRQLLAQREDKDFDKALDEFNPAEGGEGSEEEVRALPLAVRKSGDFNLVTPGYAVPGIGKFEELFKDAFTFTLDDPVASKVYVQPDTGRAYVVKLNERSSPDTKVADEELQQEKENLAFSRNIPYFQAWLKSLRQNALERGEMARTEEFQAFLSYLQTRQLEKEEQEARRAARKAQ